MSANVFIKSSQKELSQREMEAYRRYCEIIQWGRAHPIDFGRRFLGFDFYDYQSYQIMNTWYSTFALWLVCRDGAKTYDIRYSVRL